MKKWAFLFLAYVLIAVAAFAQDGVTPVSLIQLIANPEKFDGKPVALTGYLVIGSHPEFFGQQPVLYIHEEDARNLLIGNSVWVVPSEQMRRDREKINLMYVNLTGTFQAAHGAVSGAHQGGQGRVIQVQSCTPWSNPDHPIGLKENSGKYK